ncbi:MAG: DUF167 domain-containing protein [Planctomycetia bacterium]|nr:DUF167 domain-containing protein [Planctomycetia bacterium]
MTDADSLVELVARVDGVVLAVKAQPGSRRNEIKGVQDRALKVAVTQIAEKGKANKVLTDVLAKTLGVRKSEISLLTGETSSHKQFLIRNISCEELQRRISLLLSARSDS